MPNLIVSAVSTFDNKGLKKGKKEISAFDKNVQSLGKTFAKVFGTLAVANFAKNAVNAFIDSEKAASKLRTTVSNLGLAFEQQGIENYLDKLSLQFGIVDENLIPGFQRLLIVTKDVAKAQSLFETALNVSIGTSKDLTAVSTSLSKAYMGDNAALGKLGVGLSKAQLKSASFLEIKRALDVNFAGQAAAAVEGYAGSMAKLTVAVDKSKEAIGKGLLDALAALSGSSDIDTFTTKMISAAEKIGSAFRTVGDVIGLLNPNATFKMGGARLRKKDFANGNFQYGAGNPFQKAETKAIKESVTYRKQENALLKAKTAVDALRDKFDLERIGLTAALNAATDDETKLRLKAQLAILDNNEALAKKLLAEMEGTKATVELTTQFYALSEATKALLTSFGVDPSQVGPGGTIIGGLGGRSNIANLANTSINNPAFASSGAGMDLGLALGFTPGSRTGGAAPTEVIVTVNTAAGGDRLSQAIAESIQIATKNGYSTVPAGQGF